MPTLADVKARADHALFAERYEEALLLYAYLVEAQPQNLNCRMRVADALMALGEVQRAAVVYTALARHAALAGYPLRALVALKVLSLLEPKLGVLLQDVARLYARDSERIGKSVRRALPDMNAALGEPVPALNTGGMAALYVHAERVGAGYAADMQHYPEKLMPIPLLSLLPEREFAGVLHALRVVRMAPDSWVLREGDPGRSFFVLARGTAEVLADRNGSETRLAGLWEGSIFGEMALLSASPRAASVRTLTDCDLLEFDCDALGAASATLSHLSDALGGFARERLLSNVTATSAMFRPLDQKQRLDLVRRFVSSEVAAEAVVIREGDPGAGLYVVLRGDVVVARNEQVLAHLGPSDVFGEIALVTREPATATVRAGTQGASLLFLSGDYFDRLIEAIPELRSYFERLTEDRLLDLRLAADADDGDSSDIEVEVLL